MPTNYRVGEKLFAFLRGRAATWLIRSNQSLSPIISFVITRSTFYDMPQTIHLMGTSRVIINIVIVLQLVTVTSRFLWLRIWWTLIDVTLKGWKNAIFKYILSAAIPSGHLVINRHSFIIKHSDFIPFKWLVDSPTKEARKCSTL